MLSAFKHFNMVHVSPCQISQVMPIIYFFPLQVQLVAALNVPVDATISPVQLVPLENALVSLLNGSVMVTTTVGTIAMKTAAVRKASYN